MKICGAILLLFASCFVQAEKLTIQHIEPMNWWLDMRWYQVELMVHANNIGQARVELNYPGVKLLSQSATDNPNYLFVMLDINQTAKPGMVKLHFFRGKELIASHNFPLLAREKNSAARQGFATTDAIYLITPDRFSNGNTDNDNQADMLEKVNRQDKDGRQGGDLQGMLNHLDYIASMGFTQIWSNPLIENNQPKYSYHGYSATNFYRVDPRFGTNQRYKQFVKQANKKGVGVIQDIVLNHIGSHHWWMRDLPASDWLNYPNNLVTTDNFVATNHIRTSVQDPHAAIEDKEKFVRGWFVQDMPDLNQQNPHLQRYLIQNTLWWIEYAGLSGIREDTFGYADQDFLTAWAKAVTAEYPQFNLVGEEWSNNPAIVAHWQKGKINPSGHQPFMPSMMDFPIHESLRKALGEEESFSSGFIHLYETLANDFIYPNPDNLVVFGENHDTSRLYSALNENQSLYKMALVYLATIRGIPQFYAGGEILMTSPKTRDDGATRAPLPGGWEGDRKNMFTGKGLSPNERAMQAWIKKLLLWRKTASAVHHGKLEHFAPENGCYVFFRYTEQQMLMIVMNKNHQQTDLELTRFNRLLKTKTHAIDVLSSAKYEKSQFLAVPPESALILEWK